MAISEDTAALVAAQLTQAWATRMDGRIDSSGLSEGAKLIEVYNTFLKSLAEKPGVDRR